MPARPARSADDAPVVTVAYLLQQYQKEYLPHKAPTTQKQLAGLYRRIARDMGAMRLVDLTPEFLRRWRDKLKAEGYAPGTIRRFLDTLSGPLTIAVRDYEWLPSNPLRRVQKPPETPGRVRCLTPDERDVLLESCRQSGQHILYLVVLLALSTGARKMELMTLRWADVDLARGMLRFQRTKNGTRRSVPVTGAGLRLLQQHATKTASRGFVFPGQGAAHAMVDRPFKLAVHKAGIADFHFHDLRHTFASYVAMSGASTVELAALLGHRSMAMTARYVHLTSDHLTQIAAKMTREFLGDSPTGEEGQG